VTAAPAPRLGHPDPVDTPELTFSKHSAYFELRAGILRFDRQCDGENADVDSMSYKH
jgi:hypothetical protein